MTLLVVVLITDVMNDVFLVPSVGTRRAEGNVIKTLPCA